MLNTLRRSWTWFIEGLVEALLWTIDRVRRTTPLQVALGGAEVAVTDDRGRRLGHLAAGDGAGRIEPADLARRLAGATVDIVVPDAWMQRRDLDPVALASRPFLDAYVRHQIERITPWRVGDAHYRILDRPLPEDPTRLAVAVAVVPKRLVAAALATLEPLHPRTLRLRTAGDLAGACTIPLDAGRPRLVASLRTGVLRGLVATALLLLGLTAYLQWQAGLVRDDIDDQDRVLAERKAVLARARRTGDPGGEMADKLRALRDARSPAAEVISALAAALPDSAHLTALSIDGDHVTVAGVSTEPSSLVPALETSGAFAEVAFGAATTPAEGGGGDRFSLEMKAMPARSDHAGAPLAGSARTAERAP